MQWRAETAELTDRLKQYKLLLPESLLQRGLSNLGDLSRLEAAFQKLITGTVSYPYASNQPAGTFLKTNLSDGHKKSTETE